MRTIVFLGMLSILTNTFAQSRAVIKDLEAIAHVPGIGGAGNGGGTIALNISRSINRKAIALGIEGINRKYKLVVGNYLLCNDETSPCDVAAEFYADYNVVLVDEERWSNLSVNQKSAAIDLLINKISHD